MSVSRRLQAALLSLAAMACAPTSAQVIYTDHTSAKDYLTVGPGNFDSGTTTAPAAYIAADGGNIGKAYGSADHGGTVFASGESQFAGTAGGNSLLTFRVMLSGPVTTTFVPIEVVASGYTLATGTTTSTTSTIANAYAGFVVTGNYFGSVLSAYSNSTYGGYVQPILSFDESIGLRTGDWMDISMQVISSAGGAGSNAGYAEAFIDPLFIIDPTYASTYHLEGIPTPSVVPEPGGGALLLAGLALLGAVARRARSPGR